VRLRGLHVQPPISVLHKDKGTHRDWQLFLDVNSQPTLVDNLPPYNWAELRCCLPLTWQNGEAVGMHSLKKAHHLASRCLTLRGLRTRLAACNCRSVRDGTTLSSPYEEIRPFWGAGSFVGTSISIHISPRT